MAVLSSYFAALHAWAPVDQAQRAGIVHALLHWPAMLTSGLPGRAGEVLSSPLYIVLMYFAEYALAGLALRALARRFVSRSK